MNPSLMTPRRSVTLCILIVLLAAPVTAANIERIVTSSGDGLDVTLVVTGIPVGASSRRSPMDAYGKRRIIPLTAPGSRAEKLLSPSSAKKRYAIESRDHRRPLESSPAPGKIC